MPDVRGCCYTAGRYRPAWLDSLCMGRRGDVIDSTCMGRRGDVIDSTCMRRRGDVDVDKTQPHAIATADSCRHPPMHDNA